MAWTYRVRIFSADRDDDAVKAYMAKQYPSYGLRKYDVVSLEAYLNQWAEKGWELVHIEPFNHLGDNGDLGYLYADVKATYRRNYFCVFRKPVEEGR